MATYTFRKLRKLPKGRPFTVDMPMSEHEAYVEAHPELEQLITAVPTVSGVHSARSKPDEGFRDILRTIKKNNKGSTIDTH